jgi:hypothetical protein
MSDKPESPSGYWVIVWRCERVSKRGLARPLGRAPNAQFDEPSLTVGLMPRVSATHLPHYPQYLFYFRFTIYD